MLGGSRYSSLASDDDDDDDDDGIDGLSTSLIVITLIPSSA